MEYHDKLKEILNHVLPQPEKAMAALLDLFIPALFEKNSYFVEEGQKTSSSAFIIKGVMRAFYRTPDGVEYNKTFFVENSFPVSLAAVLQRSESYLNFQAMTDCEVLLADYHEIENLFEIFHSIESLVRLLLQQEWVIKKERRELNLVLYNAEERYRYFQEEYPGLENRIPQYHIASHLGITPIQLSRIRSGYSNKKS